MIAVSGCAIGKSTDQLAADSGLTTGSVPTDVEIEGVDPGDVDAIKFAIARAPGSEDGGNLISWTNPETEHGGVISDITEVSGGADKTCKTFHTTFEGYAGISLYNGQACTNGNGYWVLTSLNRDGGE